MTVLVTGGAGYIGSHTVLQLVEAGEQVIVLDDLSSGQEGAIGPQVPLYIGDIQDRGLVRALLRRHRVEAMIHFAARLDVAESVRDPLCYYGQNFGGSHALIDVAVQSGVAQHSMAVEPAQIKVRSRDLRPERFGAAVDLVVPCNNFGDYAELRLQAASAITILSEQVDDIQASYRRNANLIGQEYWNELYPSASSVYGVVSRYVTGNAQATILDVGCASEQLLHQPFVGQVGISADRRTLMTELRSTARPDAVLSSLDSFRGRDIDLVVCARVLEEAPDPRFLLEALRRIGAKTYFFAASARELVPHDGRLGGLGPPVQRSKVREWSCQEFRRFISRFFRVDEHLVVDVSNATQLMVCTV